MANNTTATSSANGFKVFQLMAGGAAVALVSLGLWMGSLQESIAQKVDTTEFARLEEGVKHIKEDVQEIKEDISEINDSQVEQQILLERILTQVEGG